MKDLPVAKTKTPTIGSAEFKKLEIKWYKKLADTGFVDHEDISRPNRPLKYWDSSRYRSYGKLQTQIQRDALVDYYDQAKLLLLTYKFKRKVHRRIWDFHCAGHTTREIAKELKLSQFIVWYWIKQIRKFM